MAPTPRRRAANGRFAADAPADLGAIRADYEAGVLSITDLCIRHSISASAVHRLVVTHGWKPRAPHRIDPGDLIMRMFALRDAQLRDLETTMREAGSADAAMLGAGAGPAVERLATQLAAKGQLTLWQYASSKDAGGALVQAPLRQIVVFRNDALRIEPYATPLPIQPLK